MPSTHVDYLVGKQVVFLPVETLQPYIEGIIGKLFQRYKQVYREVVITFSTRHKSEWDYVITNSYIPS